MDFQWIILLVIGTTSIIITEAIRIPLMRMTSPLKHLLANAHESKYKTIIEQLDSLSGSKNTVPLFKFLDYEFYGNVLIGHQHFKVIFDTAWSDLWVPSVRCPATNTACALRNKYDESKSTSSIDVKKKYNRELGAYNISGKVFMDLVHIGGFNITNQTFGAVENLPWEDFLLSKADGIFGLSFDIFVADGITPFLYSMFSQQLIPKKIFSLYINRDPSTKKGGSLLLGDIDTKHYKGNLSYVSVEPNIGFWQIPVDGISIPYGPTRNASFCEGGCFSILDSSTNEIRGPPGDIDTINGILKARSFLFGRSVIDCGRVSILPHVTITIGEKAYILKGKDIVQQMTYGPVKICLSSFSRYESDGKAKWVFGGAFMSRYYTVFDMEKIRVGFGRSDL